MTTINDALAYSEQTEAIIAKGLEDLAAVQVALVAATNDIQAAKASSGATTLAIKASIIPPEPPQPVIKDVKFYGAKLDGVTDDTAAFQAAADTGSIIVVGPGKVRLNVVKQVKVTKDKTIIRMTSDLEFITDANNAQRYYFFNVTASDCDIDCGGAQFIGDRFQHTYGNGTHEWGYGFFIGGARNKLRNVGISNCTGDGVGVTGPDHEIGPGVVCKKNRRQGLSAFRSANLWIHDSEFSETGNAGKPDPSGLIGPFCGIDVEPDKGVATGIRIERNTLANNQKSGIIFWVRSDLTDVKLDGVILDNNISGSPNGIWAMDEAVRAATINLVIQRNRIHWTSGSGTRIDQGVVATVGGDAQADANIYTTRTDRPDVMRNGKQGSPYAYDIAQKSTGKATVKWNGYQ